MSDYDMSIHTNPDARAWAKFYTDTRNKSSDPTNFDDEENMIGWFANAMMAMHDHMRPDLAPRVTPDGSASFVANIPAALQEAGK
jgi:hypothetical protein